MENFDSKGIIPKISYSILEWSFLSDLLFNLVSFSMNYKKEKLIRVFIYLFRKNIYIQVSAATSDDSAIVSDSVG